MNWVVCSHHKTGSFVLVAVGGVCTSFTEAFAGLSRGVPTSGRCMEPYKGVGGEGNRMSPKRLDRGARRALGSELKEMQV